MENENENAADMTPEQFKAMLAKGIQPTVKPVPLVALQAASEIESQEDVRKSVLARNSVQWECNESGFTVNAEYQVGKVVAGDAQIVLGFCLIPTRMNAQSKVAQRLLLGNVPFINVPSGMPEDKVKEACEKMKMPRWFANGTPPRKTPAKGKAKSESGWEV